jgi:hypothetical protein
MVGGFASAPLPLLNRGEARLHPQAIAVACNKAQLTLQDRRFQARLQSSTPHGG